jgi:hypothetical protein
MYAFASSLLIRVALSVAAAAALGSCRSQDPEATTGFQPSVLEFRITANGDLTEGAPVRLEPLLLPRLEELKRREHLESIVAGAQSEFSTFLLLRDWVSSQWPAGYPDPYPPWDAIVVLDWIREGITGGFCAQYAQLLLQSLAALGYQARYIEIGSADNPYAHFLTEVWSNEFNKWVVLDPDFNVHFERNRIPLSALEIHDALLESGLGDVTVVSGTHRPGHSNATSWPLRTAELYYYVRVHLNANHLSAPHEHPFHRYDDMVEWLDELTVPWEFSQVDSPFAKVRLTNLQSNDRTYFEGRMNQVRLTADPSINGSLDIRLENNVHDFRNYEVRTLSRVGEGRDWEYHLTNTLLWRPTRHSRILEVRGINQAGVPGPVSRVVAFLGAPNR